MSKQHSALTIKSDFQKILVNSLLKQIENSKLPKFVSEQLIGFVETTQDLNPVKRIETSIRGSEEYQGETSEKAHDTFSITTTYHLSNDTYLQSSQIHTVIRSLLSDGYEVERASSLQPKHVYLVEKDSYVFSLDLGFESASTQIRTLIEKKSKSAEKEIQIIEAHDHASALVLGLGENIDSPMFPSTEYISPDNIDQYFNEAKELSEKVYSAILLAFEIENMKPIHMDWLPPEAVEQMDVAESTHVTGSYRDTLHIESTVKQSLGFDRLIGIPDETLDELIYIKNLLNNEKKTAFLKKYGFNHSTGAIFWGPPGTGKTLAGKALSEEINSEHVLLKVDQYMTAFVHDSAHKLGRKLRAIKAKSVVSAHPTVVQIDEADTILMPIQRESINSRDAAEVRAVLLREFQEPSNIFYILTTNFDPQDPKNVDPALVRNQRQGYFVYFNLPNKKKRKEILINETNRRTGEDMVWHNIDFDEISEKADGFSPADLQEALSFAANSAYNTDDNRAKVNQSTLLNAIAGIHSRKQK